MSLDAAKMAQFAAKAMDQLEALDNDLTRGELGEIAIVVEIKNVPLPLFPGETGPEEGTAIRWVCTDERVWVAKGLLQGALEAS